MTALQKKFVRQLAVYLVDKQAMKSIQLEMGNPAAKEWSALRFVTPLSGYPTVDEAEKQLTAWLFE